MGVLPSYTGIYKLGVLYLLQTTKEVAYRICKVERLIAQR